MDTRLASNTRSGHRLGWVLGLTSTAYFMVVLDSLVVVSALPHMQHDLHASVPSLQWTVNSYGISFAADRPTLVEWTVTECAFLPDWVGTRPTFTITPVENDRSELFFRHHGLTPELACIEMCTLGWNSYLTSLRRYVESGQGSPFGS